MKHCQIDERHLAKFKLDWWHSPKEAIPPCPHQSGMNPPHNGKPADPEFRYYYLLFKSKEDAMEFVLFYQINIDYPDYRILSL